MSADFSWTNYFGALIILIRCLSWTQCMNMDRRKRPRYYLSWNSMDMITLVFMTIIINHHLNEHEGASFSSSKERTKHSKINLGVRSQTVSPSSLLSSNIFIIISINSFSSQPPLSPLFQLLPCRDDDDCEKDGKASTKVFHQPSWDPQASEQVRHLDHHHPWWSST